ncbi:MAG: SDR family oxidoreductase [Vulcanimicrobiaceae bacterium]
MNAIFVTGASTGIGLATAQLLAERGKVVYAGVRNDADASRLGSLHANIRPVRADVTDAASLEAAVSRIASDGCTLRGVVANAGVAIAGPLEFVPLDQIRTQFEINVIGVIATIQAALPELRKTKGRIVIVGSIAGRMAPPFVGPYGASKFAIEAINDCLRIELRPFGIAVSLIEPGAVNTPIWQKGRDRAATLSPQFPPTVMEYYGSAIAALQALSASEEEHGIPPLDVARSIEHALTSAHPKPRYICGGPAKVQAVIARLPEFMRDALMRRVMKIP